MMHRLALIRAKIPRSLPELAYLAGRGVRFGAPIAVRLAVLAYFLVGLAPAPPRIVPYPPQTVSTKHPIVCVHTRLTDEVEDWKIQRSLQLVREMGATTIVEFFPWAYIQVSEDEYNWNHAERLINMARHEGLQVIARLGVVPGWARPKPSFKHTSHNYLEPIRYDDYARFVARFAEHFRGKILGLIVWNEPNLSREWDGRIVPPGEYVDFLRRIYQAVKATAPEVIVMAGALAPTLEPPNSPNGLDDIEYLRGMYAAGGARYFDALSVHTYGFTSPPDAEPASDRLNFRRYELLYDVMVQNGDGDKPVYITESGWNDHPRWTLAVHSGQRLQYTIDSYRLAERNWPNVKNLCFWYFRIPLPTRNYIDYFAFVTTEFRVKPIYTAVQEYALDRVGAP
jgi:hypothetical protein